MQNEMQKVVSSIKLQDTAFVPFQFKVLLVRLDVENVRDDCSMLVQRISVLRIEILFFACIISYISVFIFLLCSSLEGRSVLNVDLL